MRFLARLAAYLSAYALGIALDYALYAHAAAARWSRRLGCGPTHRLRLLRHKLLVLLYVGLGLM